MDDHDTTTAAREAEAEELGGRLVRLVAYMIDSFLVGVITLGIGIPLGWTASVLRQDPTHLMELAVLSMVVFGVINGRWLVTRGQTVAKRLLGVRIVDARTRELVPLVKSFGLRHIVVQAVMQIPTVGVIFALADALFIFGERRRCLHDYLAGTIVVPSVRPSGAGSPSGQR